MSGPLDHDRASRIGTVRLARTYSNAVSPPTIFAVLGLVLSYREVPDFWPGLGWAAAYGLLTSLVPILFVFYLLHSKRIAELHMSVRRERHLPYLVAALCAGLAFVLLRVFEGPVLLQCLTVFNVIELTALGLINVYWLISIHATGITAAWLIVALVFGWMASLIVVPFALSVFWVRLYLRRHSTAQVVAGIGLGILSVLTLSATGCFG